MKLWLIGHGYRYAAEQMLSTLFPGEGPEYCEEAPAEGMVIRLSRAEQYTTATCRYRHNGEIFYGLARAKSEPNADAIQTESCEQYLLKNAVYRAVMASGRTRMPWGALTGVRPGKLMHAILKRDPDRARAVAEFMGKYDVTRERAELCYETAAETERAEQTLREKDICLYVGIPFCPTRCAYCSFVSQAVEKNKKLMEPFLEALQKELQAIAEQVRKLDLQIVAIYFGGGTPTTLNAEQLEALCRLLENEFDLTAVREYTVEAGRPDTITKEKLEVLRRHGVDRISVNPQTMQDSVLEAIGRKHTAKDVLDALALAREVGGFRINMDLIAGLPQDDLTGFQATMEQVLALQPENITVHTLSLKRGSSLSEEKGKIPSAGEVAAMLDTAYELLRKEGYAPYYLYRQKNMSGGFENTGWTKPGAVNLYNICMMEELCSILAAGGGGSTKLVRNGNGKNIRLAAPKYPLEYIQQIETTCKNKQTIGDFYGV